MAAASPPMLKFLPDGNTLLAGDADSLRIWRAPLWAEIEAAEKMVRLSP
jgi:hypothetical protein